MLCHTRRQAIHPQPSSSGHARMPLQWPASIAMNLFIAGAIGFLYSLLVLGPAPLDPTHLSWLWGDLATYYIGWELFRQDPHLHWPLTFTERLGYPLGDSIAFMDPNPLLLTLLKPLSPLLPTPFQYLGIAAVLATALQFFFAARLFQLLLGRHVVGVLLPSLFFLIAPPMTSRLGGHYSLANHWLLVAALCLFVSLQKASGDQDRKHFFFCGLLGGVAVGVNPYLAFMVVILVSAGVIAAWCGNRVSWKTAGGMLAATAGTCLLSAFAFGLIRSDGGYSWGGYREYSMDLLAPIDAGINSFFLRPLSSPSSPRSFESFNYLGAGVLMLGVMMLPSFSRVCLQRLTATAVVPLAVACFALTALAISTKVSVGSFLIADLDPHETLTEYLAVFRGSARLFWAPYYVILTAILATPFAIWRPRKAAVLVAMALVVQFADIVPLLRAVRTSVSASHPLPFHSPHWTSLGQAHANLLVFPPWQCGADSPGGPDSFRIFGMLAVSQHMRTNSYYAARYSPTSLAFHCHQAIRDLLTKPLSPESVYIASPMLARTIAAGPSGPDACRTLDGFILCSTKTDFGLGPGAPMEVFMPEIPMMYASGHIESWLDAANRGFFIGDWQAAEPEGIWSKGYGVVQFRLTPELRSRYHAVSLRLVVPVGPKGVRYQIRSGSQDQSGTFSGDVVPRAETFEARVLLQDPSKDIERIVLVTQDAVRPIDIGMNSDTRLLGLGVLDIRLVP
jgi:Family of unknown function (DUF6311)